MGYKKLILSGEILETYEYEKDLNRSKTKRGVSSRHKRSHFRRKDNVARLRKLFVRLVRSNIAKQKSPILLTLTMAQVLRIDIAYECFSRFIKRMRNEYGQEWSYIAVPEFQKRGAVHFHALVWNLPESQNIANERYSRDILRLWSFGFCDVRATDGSPKLAGYLGKYMQKALHDERLLSQKSYVCSRNCVRPLSYTLGTVFDYKKELFGETELISTRKFDTQWLGSCTYTLEKLDTNQNENKL